MSFFGSFFSHAEKSVDAIISLPQTIITILTYGSILVGAVLLIVGVGFAIGEVKGNAPSINIPHVPF